MEQKSPKMCNWSNIKEIIYNWPFLLIFLQLGATIAYCFTIFAQIEQILCSGGYSDQIVKISGSSMIICGFFAAFPISFIAYKTKKSTLVCKFSTVFILIAAIMIASLFRMPDKSAGIIVACVLLGIFGIGTYPLMLELLVECTYPFDQVFIGLKVIFIRENHQNQLSVELVFLRLRNF